MLFCVKERTSRVEEGERLRGADLGAVTASFPLSVRLQGITPPLIPLGLGSRCASNVIRALTVKFRTSVVSG